MTPNEQGHPGDRAGAALSWRDQMINCRFSAAERKRLEDDFLRQKPHEWKLSAKCHVDWLENFAEGLIASRNLKPKVEHKERKRSLKNLAEGLEKAAGALKELDIAAANFLWSKIGEELMPDCLEETIKSFVSHENTLSKRRLLDRQMMTMALAARKAERSLPPAHFRSRLPCVISLCRHLGDCGIRWSVSGDGFAARCFRAITTLAGEPVEDPSYWLKQVTREEDDCAAGQSEKRWRRRADACSARGAAAGQK